MDQDKLNKLSSKLDERSEKLDEYIHVAGVRIWIVLIAILTLLAGVICWGFLGRLETKVVSILSVSPNGGKYCMVKDNEFEKIKVGMSVETDTVSGTIVSLGNYDEGTQTHLLEVDIDIDSGIYLCNIIIDDVAPISLLFQ